MVYLMPTVEPDHRSARPEPVRIALCGSQVAGKSSLLRAIASQRSFIQRLVSRHRRDLQVIQGESEDPLIRLTLASLKKSDSEIEIVAPTGAMFWPERTFRRVLNGATHALFAFAKPIDGDYQSEHFSFQRKYYEIFVEQAGQLGFESSALKIVLTKSD